MAESSSPRATPKRKRDDLISEQLLSPTSPQIPAHPLHSNRTIFSFESPGPNKPVSSDQLGITLDDDGSSSPRTKVAQKFRDLALERGGGVEDHAQTAAGASPATIPSSRAEPEYSPTLGSKTVFGFDGSRELQESSGGAMQIDEDGDSTTRKRVKLPATESDPAPGSSGEASANAVDPVKTDNPDSAALQVAVQPVPVKNPRASIGKLQKSYPSINRLSESKSRRKRTGTPPPSAKRKAASINNGPADEEPEIVDPVRAALTWHEDEITIYDPEDKDDDGTGINGVGFKPTPALAFERAQKRKKQLAEYRKREESEARARRNARRRDALGEGPGHDRKHSISRVRFTEAEPTTVITT